MVAMSPSVFVTPDGLPVANGYLIVRPYSGGNLGGNMQLQSNGVRVPLDSTGTIINNEFVIDTFYTVSVYTFHGQLIAGPILVQITD